METDFYNNKYDFIETARKILNSNDSVEYDDNERAYYDRYGNEIITVDHLEEGRSFTLNNTLHLYQEAYL
jgi:hypothetical protein